MPACVVLSAAPIAHAVFVGSSGFVDPCLLLALNLSSRVSLCYPMRSKQAYSGLVRQLTEQYRHDRAEVRLLRCGLCRASCLGLRLDNL